MENLEQRCVELAGEILDESRPLCSASEIIRALDGAPFFTSLAKIWLERSCRECPVADEAVQAERRAVARKAIAAMPSQATEELYRMAGLAHGEMESDQFYPPVKEAVTPTTDDTIDRFLSTYTQSDSDEEALIERLIFNPVPDYASVLAEQERCDLPMPDEAPEGSTDALINSFILKTHDREAERATLPDMDVASRPLMAPPPVADGRPVATPPPPRDDSTLRESLAKFYIKRKRYRQAYEIIEQLNLNYPEKNIYFAPQLRFLAKLIANEEARRRRESKSSE